MLTTTLNVKAGFEAIEIVYGILASVAAILVLLSIAVSGPTRGGWYNNKKEIVDPFPKWARISCRILLGLLIVAFVFLIGATQ